MAPTVTLEMEIATLRDAGADDAVHPRALELARAYPAEARAQLAAAFACDRLGLEHDAVGYYAAAHRLGVPAELRIKFLVGFGATLRNVGRAAESLAVLTDAVREHPDNLALLAFKALALHANGHADAALATMLEAALRGARAGTDAFAPFARALAEYQAELAASANATRRAQMPPG